MHISRENNDKEKEQTDESVSIDFSKIKNIFQSKYINLVFFIALLIIPIFLTIYIRVQPQYLPATEDWATNSVYNYYKNGIAQQVYAQYPNLPQQQRDVLIEEQFNQYLKTDTGQLDAQITETANYFKTGFQYTENGNTYTFLGDLDSYFYLRQVRNIQDKGMVCDDIIDGKCRDTYKIAPLGDDAVASMHPYGIFYFYKIAHMFNPKINLMQSAFLIPTLIAIIATIAAFFIGRRLMNTAAGFFAAMFVSLSPMFITRTLGSDTDIWNVMFPLVIVWVVLEAFYAHKTWQKIVYSSITGLLTGLFSFAWGGWWYVFDIIIAAMISYIIILLVKNYIKHRKISHLISSELKTTGIIFVTIILSTILFVSTISSFSAFVNVIAEPIGRTQTLKFATNADLWPNVLTTVAELNEASIDTIINQTAFGMGILFALSLLGIIFILIKKNPGLKEYLLIVFSAVLFIFLTSQSGLGLGMITYLIILAIPIAIAILFFIIDKDTEISHEKIDIKPALLFTIWFIGTIFASTRGVRFILLLTPVFGISIGIAIGYIYKYLVKLFTSMKITEVISKVIVFSILFLILIIPIQAGMSAGKNFVPSMTKGWWDALTKIREESKPDAIINSWWDFGHWFKYVSDRRVTLDGASQNHPNAHWLGKILQSNNEKESVAILRMLDCGSNSFFEKINEKYMDTEISQNVVKDVILMDKNNATSYLKNLGFENAEEIIKLSHCDPPENYFITSEDMVGKAGVWAHFGLWDFDRAFIINEVRPKSLSEGAALLKSRFNYSNEDATRIYYEVQALQTDREINDWISPWPSYAGGLIGCQESSGLVQCKINMAIGNNGQTTTVIDRAIINVTRPENSEMILAFYDQTGRKLQETSGSFNELVIIDNTTKKYKSTNASLSLAMLLNVDRQGNQTSYSALIADPLLIDSTFTKLFFLDGKNMNSFEKFYDTTDITGTRIIIWKVKW